MLLGEQRGIDEISVSLEARYPSEEEQAETEGRTVFDYLPLRGIWVALVTFIPTFLAVFIGLPQLLTSAPARHATEPRAPEAPLSATMSLTGLSTPTGWSADLRPGYLARSVSSGPETWGRPTTLVHEAPTPRPSPEATEPAASGPTVFGPKAPKPAAAEDSAWAPAAAFADNQTAARLASTMRSQGYRVDVRHEDAATRPWVVWIKANPQNRRADETRPAPAGSRR